MGVIHRTNCSDSKNPETGRFETETEKGAVNAKAAAALASFLAHRPKVTL